MSVEDKEPYFDGPLVTPNTGASMFYSGHNQPLPQVQQIAVPNTSGPAMVAPTFYNPNEFAAAAAPVSVWQPEPMQNNVQVQQQNNAMAGDAASGCQGMQAYFGGLDSNSSATSSQHTSPQHFSPQKLSDNSHIPPMEPQPYSSPSHVTYHPLLNPANQWKTSTQNPSNNPNSNALSMSPLQDGHQISPESSILDPATIASTSSGGHYIYSQPEFLNPVTSSGNSGLQNYMNPESSDAILPQMLPNQMENMNSNQQNYEAEKMLMYNYDNKAQDWNSLNAVDLHNVSSIPSSSQDSSDQSYMNMAHTNNYGGSFVQPAVQTAGATGHSVPDFPTEQPAIPVPTSSTQDYDILHSQGTWNDTRHNFASNYGQVQSSSSYYDQPTAYDERLQRQQQHQDVLANKMENLQVENDPEDPGLADEQTAETNNDTTQVEGVTSSGLQQASQNLQTEESDTVEEVASISTASGIATDNSNLYSQSQASENSSPQKQNIESIISEVTSSHMNDEMTARDLTGQDNVQLLGSLPSVSYAYGPVATTSSKLQPENIGEDLREDVSVPPSIGTFGAQTMHSIALPPNQDRELPSSSTGTSNVLPTDYSEPIKDMSQDNRDVVVQASNSDTAHNTVKVNATSENSAFTTSVSTLESRMRSQSTGSNNSTTSSQKSVGSQKSKPPASTQLRQNFMSAHATEQQSTGNPFSTNTMHSSHIEMTAPSSSSSTTYNVQLRLPASVPEVGHKSNAHAEGDENLRTGATVLRNNPQSLHSQVLSGYSAASASTIPGPPMMPAVPDQLHNLGQAAMSSVGTVPESDLTASVSTKLEDKMRAGPPTLPNVTNSDPYLSRSLHTTTADQYQHAQSTAAEPTQRYQDPIQRTESQATQVHSPERIHNESWSQHQEIPSSHLAAMNETADLYQRDISVHAEMHHDKPQHQTAIGAVRDRREDERRGEWEPRRQDRDSRITEDSRYDRDHHDSRYRTTGYNSDRPLSRQGLEQGPRLRQGYRDSSHPYDDREYNRDYSDPYYHHYRADDRYYDDRYYRHPGYSRKEYDPYETRRYDRYYYPYQRYRNEDYYYNDYYGDDRYRPQQYGADEDTRSVYSEKSRNIDHEPLTDRSHREWQQARTRSSYAEHPSYMHDYDSQDYRYYGDSFMDETTISANYDESWQRLPQVPTRQTPVKFATTHTIARFGPGGHLVKVLPNRPTDNQPCKVEIHSIEILLENTEEAENLRSYPGPLSKEETHKNDILQFSSLYSAESLKNIQLIDRQSTALIWDFLALLVRQNGSVLGSDIAELLMKGHSGDFKLLQSPQEAANRQRQQLNRTTTPSSLLDDAQSPAPEETESVASSSDVMSRSISLAERNSNRFRELLLHGRKKDSLEWAMKTGLWGHALLLASKTDSRTHAQVMLRFANSLPINDPLQTVYQLMSGRQPAAATCVAEEGWGDWRPHLAMVLSNPTASASLDMRAVLTMGDTLATKGLLHAAHFCYLMASTPLGYFGRPSSKMVLLGANHMLPFKEFSTWDAIRRTEIYEYAISLGKSQNYSVTALPSFQLYKFIYACNLAEYGLVNQAFHYCERIAKAVCRNPSNYSATLVGQLLNVSEQLKHHDPQVQAGTLQPNNLRWLEALRNVDARIQSGAIAPASITTPSVIAASNTPSLVSTAPTSSPSPNDEIRFSAHSPDLDEDEVGEDEVDTEYQRSPLQTEPHYGMQPVVQHGDSSATVQAPVPMLPVNTGTYQPQMYQTDKPQQSQYGTYYNPESHQQNQEYQDSAKYNLQQYQFQQQQQTQQQQLMNNQAYEIQQGIGPPFSDLVHQANPLASSVPMGPPTLPQQQVPHQQAHYNQQMNEPSTEQNNQMDYYDHVSAMPSQRFTTSHMSSRSRTVSQSSQRSRASTLKGYDRNSPTSMMNTDKKQRSRTTSENSSGRRSRKTSGEQKNYKQSNKSGQQSSGDTEVKKSSSWSLFGWLSRRRSNQVHLPDDTKKEIYWDNDKKRWVNINASEEENSPPPPPPMDSGTIGGASGLPIHPQQPMMAGPMLNQTQTAPAAGNQSPSLTANRFSLKNLGSSRSMYKNVLSSSSTPPAAAPPPEMLPGMTTFNPQKNTGFMVPNAALGDAPISHDSSPMATSTPNHPAEMSQTIPMFSPGNTPQGSASDFTQPFNHAGNSRSSSVSSGAREIRKLVALSEDAENAGASTAQGPSMGKDNAPGPTMFYNPSQFGTSPLAGPPSMTPLATGQNNRIGVMRGRGRGFPGRR